MEITALKGIGEKTAKLFGRLGIVKAEDLLRYYPRDYEQFQPPVPIAEAPVGEKTAIRGIVIGNMTVKQVRSLQILNAAVQDATGTVQITFFNMPYLKSTLKKGVFHIFRGQLQKQGNRLVMEQPAIYKPEVYAGMENRLLPRYILTKGLSNQAVTKAVNQAFACCASSEEFLPESVVGDFRFMTHMDAVRTMHFPTDRESLVLARKRLVFEEFFLFILMLRRMKADNHELPNFYRMTETAETVRLLDSLPYQLTGAQKRVWEEIKSDLSGDTVMSRLIQGEVGS